MFISRHFLHPWKFSLNFKDDTLEDKNVPPHTLRGTSKGRLILRPKALLL